jgi:hypothetical protein
VKSRNAVVSGTMVMCAILRSKAREAFAASRLDLKRLAERPVGAADEKTTKIHRSRVAWQPFGRRYARAACAGRDEHSAHWAIIGRHQPLIV